MPQALGAELQKAACCLCGLFFSFGGGRSQVSGQGYADVCARVCGWLFWGVFGVCVRLCVCVYM